MFTNHGGWLFWCAMKKKLWDWCGLGILLQTCSKGTWWLIVTCIALLMCRQGIRAVVVRNHLSLATARALASAPSGRFPYVGHLAARARLERTLLRAGRIAGASACEEVRCARLRAYLALMSWDKAKELARTTECTSFDMRSRPASWAVLDGLDSVSRGDVRRARSDLHRALGLGSGFLSPSLQPWLVQLGQRPSHSASASRDVVMYDIGGLRLVLDGTELASGQPLDAGDWSRLPAAVETNPRLIEWFSALPDGAHLMNLLPDSGLEWSAEGYTPWVVPGQYAWIAPETNASGTSRVLTVRGNPAGGGVIVSSPRMPLLDGCTLLVGAWVASDGASSAISLVWHYPAGNASGPPFVNLAGLEGSYDWKSVGELVTPPESATEFSLYVSKWTDGISSSPVTLKADNLFVLAIPGDATASQCGPYDRVGHVMTRIR